MAEDPVCNRNVDEKTAKQNMYHNLMETKYTYVLLRVNNNSINIHQNMDIETNQ